MDTFEGVLVLAGIVITVLGVPVWVIWSMASESTRPVRSAVQTTTWFLWLVVAVGAFSAMIVGLTQWGIGINTFGWIVGALLVLAAITWHSRENG